MENESDKAIKEFVHFLSEETKFLTSELIHIIQSDRFETANEVSGLLVESFYDCEDKIRSGFFSAYLSDIKKNFSEKMSEIDGRLDYHLQQDKDDIELNPNDLEIVLNLAKEINRLVNFN